MCPASSVLRRWWGKGELCLEQSFWHKWSSTNYSIQIHKAAPNLKKWHQFPTGHSALAWQKTQHPTFLYLLLNANETSSMLILQERGWWRRFILTSIFIYLFYRSLVRPLSPSSSDSSRTQVHPLSRARLALSYPPLHLCKHPWTHTCVLILTHSRSYAHTHRYTRAHADTQIHICMRVMCQWCDRKLACHPQYSLCTFCFIRPDCLLRVHSLVSLSFSFSLALTLSV